jgi:hypothetical protein
MIATFLALTVIVWSVAVALIVLIGRHRGWSKALQAALAVASFVVTAGVLLVALFFGFLIPIEDWSMQWKLAAIEKHLYVGESRADVEAHFGHDVPVPDRTDGYSVTSQYAVPGWGDHLGQYAYAAGGALCVAYYRGVVVYYDVSDHVKFWKRYGFGDGC